MGQRFRRSANTVSSSQIPNENAEAIALRDCLSEVEICCEQARDASRCRRFGAAVGLFSTAVALCRRALASAKIDDATRQTLREKIERVSSEMAAHAQLARSMQRPLRAPSNTPTNARSSTRSEP